MRFSTKIVEALLSEYETKNYIVGDKHKKHYRWVSLLPKDERDLDPDILYVCRTSEALQRNHILEDLHFITSNDCFFGLDAWNNRERLKNLIILTDTQKDVPWILNLIQKRFLELNDWHEKMQSVLMNGGGYQELIDVSEPIFENSLFVLDDAFRLLAYGKQYLSDDPMHLELYRRGYYGTELLDQWYSSGRIDDYRNNPNKTLYTNKIGLHPSISKWCRHDGILLTHGVLVFSHKPMAEDTTDLFEIFMESVQFHFERNISTNQGALLPHNSLFIDIINGKITDVQQIEEAANDIGMPATGAFNLYRIAFQDIGKVLIGSFVQRLGALLPDAKIVTNGSDVFVINSLQTIPQKADAKERLSVILPLLEEHGGICGISFPYTRFSDLRIAGIQALYALQFGPRAKLLLSKESRSNFLFFYSDIINLCMIENSRKGDFDPMYNNVYRARLNLIREFDNKNNSNLFDILFVYLVNERHATEAAVKLHMHRSTVLYHIQKINDLLQMDLNEFLVRQGLITAYLDLMLERFVSESN